MRRPRFALSMMLGAMALSLAALGLPPCANGPAAGRDTPNAALICPASDLAAESHPFRWFETVTHQNREDVVDGWVRTVVVPVSSHSSSAMRLDRCDLSVVSRQQAEAATARLALELSGLVWWEYLGACPSSAGAAPADAHAMTSDASDLAADYRHSTGNSEAFRLNLRQGRSALHAGTTRHRAELAKNEVAAAFPDDFVLAAVRCAADAYERYYRTQQSADAAAQWMRLLAQQFTAGWSELARLTVPFANEAALARNDSPIADEQVMSDYGSFELASDDGSRFVYLRAADEDKSNDVEITLASTRSLVPEAFELVVDGPDRFLFIRTDGLQAPPTERTRSIAVMLPRPFPPASAIGIDADWLAWDYFTLQVNRELELTRDEPVDADEMQSETRSETWNCFASSRHQDTPREQIEAEEAASDGISDSIQDLIRQQADSEDARPAAKPAAASEGFDHGLFSPPGCHGQDPIGCLELRRQLRAERWASSTALSLSRLAALIEGFASRLRDAAANPLETAPPAEPQPEQPSQSDSTEFGGCLEPIERAAASQRFLSESYLGL